MDRHDWHSPQGRAKTETRHEHRSLSGRDRADHSLIEHMQKGPALLQWNRFGRRLGLERNRRHGEYTLDGIERGMLTAVIVSLIRRWAGRWPRRSDIALSRTAYKERPSMRLPFFDPPGEEVAAVASDLIIRFGLRARDEALYLAGLSEQMRARWNRQLYRLAAREMETSFAEARRRLDVEGAPESRG
jgi:hypothetical protein